MPSSNSTTTMPRNPKSPTKRTRKPKSLTNGAHPSLAGSGRHWTRSVRSARLTQRRGAQELAPAAWIEEFDEHGLGGDIRAALERVQAWIAKGDPAEEVARILYNRSPDILLFSDDHRILASSYELTDENVGEPPAALGNICRMAELSLPALWKTINNGDEGLARP